MFLSSVDFSKKFFKEYHSLDPDHARGFVGPDLGSDILSGLIWVQSVCKGNQQATLVGKEFMRAIQVNWGVHEI